MQASGGDGWQKEMVVELLHSQPLSMTAGVHCCPAGLTHLLLLSVLWSKTTVATVNSKEDDEQTSASAGNDK